MNTKQNPADAPSRGGMQDPVVREQLKKGRWVDGETKFDWNILLGVTPEKIWKIVTTLGSRAGYSVGR